MSVRNKKLFVPEIPDPNAPNAWIKLPEDPAKEFNEFASDDSSKSDHFERISGIIYYKESPEKSLVPVFEDGLFLMCLSKSIGWVRPRNYQEFALKYFLHFLAVDETQRTSLTFYSQGSAIKKTHHHVLIPFPNLDAGIVFSLHKRNDGRIYMIRDSLANCNGKDSLRMFFSSNKINLDDQETITELIKSLLKMPTERLNDFYGSVTNDYYLVKSVSFLTPKTEQEQEEFIKVLEDKSFYETLIQFNAL